MLKSASIIFLFVALPLSGCRSMSGYPDGRKITLIPQEGSENLKDSTLRNCLSEKCASKKKTCRDEIIRSRMAWGDQNFYQFERALREESVRSDLGVDWLELIISAAISTVGGGQTKSILGVVSTTIQGAKSAFDKHTFREKSIDAILAHMRFLRMEQELVIRKRLVKSVQEYPLEAALVDLSKYYNAGTVSEAMISLVATAESERDEAEKNLTTSAAKGYVQ